MYEWCTSDVVNKLVVYQGGAWWCGVRCIECAAAVVSESVVSAWGGEGETLKCFTRDIEFGVSGGARKGMEKGEKERERVSLEGTSTRLWREERERLGEGEGGVRSQR